jgi:peptidoglycan/LPS O-acetylase OafA/YrhL
MRVRSLFTRDRCAQIRLNLNAVLMTMPKPDPPATAASLRYIPALDGVRALAILLVIPHNVDLLRPPLPLAAYPVALLMHSGWIGVQLFFVLSGFLITGNLLDTRGSANYFRVFFGRRALRILPLYLGVLTLTFLILPAFIALPEPLRASASHQIWFWTFLANWVQPFGATVYGFGHFWSLAVEEQFYLLWPLVVLRHTPQALLKLCLSIIVGALLIRIVLLSLHAPPDAVYMFTVSRMDALAFGAIVAILVRTPEALARIRSSTYAIAWIALAILIITLAGTSELAMYDARTQSVGYTTLSIVFALLILLTVVPTTGALGLGMTVLAWRPLRRIGRYSFGMYVFHLPLHVFFGVPLLQRIAPHLTPRIELTYTVCITLVTFILAAVSFELFERRFLDMKHRLVPSLLTAA